MTLARLYKRRSNCNKLENITFYISTLNSGWYKLRFISYFLFVGEFNFPSQSMEERRNFGFIAHLLFIRGVPAQWTSSSNTFPMGSLSTLWLIHTILNGWISSILWLVHTKVFKTIFDFEWTQVVAFFRLSNMCLDNAILNQPSYKCLDTFLRHSYIEIGM